MRQPQNVDGDEKEEIEQRDLNERDEVCSQGRSFLEDDVVVESRTVDLQPAVKGMIIQ